MKPAMEAQSAASSASTSARIKTKTHSVADQIKSYLVQLDLAKGARLPAERELAQALGITRSILRRGLDQLDAEGFIWRHVGKGTFIGSSPAGTASLSAGMDSYMNPHDLMEVRLFLEPPAVGLAAIRATTAELDEIQACLENSLKASTALEYEHWDGRLHRAIIKSTKNLLLVKIGELFESARDERVWGKLKERSSTPERREHYSRQHRAIVNALLDRNRHEAESQMREHLIDVQTDLLRASGQA
ncbi:FadR/GntR family transcriptional regulator [Sodalis ligni]|uniref:DNA-binding FadR family transcriptional regulator n=1 Tax=Sodalis ligni TaxID=2697027 RepID=A0A4R1NLQ7_9GAMM|nr:FCD domain-containing protein [Sodalis ligni]TCL05160.1 DNA-binding FadR family transcriptional regulator [Sodalis ligni]